MWVPDSLVEGGIVFVSRGEDNQVHLYTEAIDYLGAVKIDNRDLLRELQSVRASITVRQIDRDNDSIILTLVVN